MASTKSKSPSKKKSPRRPKRRHPSSSQTAPILATRFSRSQLLRRFHKLLPGSLLMGWLAIEPKAFYQRAFTPLVTLWYFLFQRLAPNHTLSQVLQDAGDGGADRFSPKGKPLSQRLTSESTSSLNDARHRLPLTILRQCLRHIAQQVLQAFPNALWLGHPVALVDGTTLRMRPLGQLPEEFPPHRPGNSKHEPYWCVSRTVGMFCLATGIALDSVMESLKTSEQALCCQLLQAQSWIHWILVADRNFGVFSVARCAQQAKAHLLSRMTKVRAAKLARSLGLPLTPGLDVRVTWKPSRHDRCPSGVERRPVEGRLLVIRLQRAGRWLDLYLFTTLLDAQKYTPEALAKLYGQRWQVELNFRYVKDQMDLAFLNTQSADMARKEWLAGLAAYNLIRYTMAAAALLAEIPVQQLSFSRARDLLVAWCKRAALRSPAQASWKRLLERIAKAKLPRRRKPRPSEPRAIRPFAIYFPKLLGSRAAARAKLAAPSSES